MTAKSLHKKITDTNTLCGRKHEKRNPSNRALLSVDAQKEIQQGIDNPSELCLCEHADHMQKHEQLYDYRNEKILNELGLEIALKPVQWTTNPYPKVEFIDYINKTDEEEYKREIMGDWSIDIDPHNVHNGE